MTPRSILSTLAALLFGCGGATFQDSVDHGVPNLVEVAHGSGLWRMGHPQTRQAWDYLASKIAPTPGTRVTVVQLHDDEEGDDLPATDLGWTLVKAPMPPEDDRPWTIFQMPSPSGVHAVVGIILAAHARGDVVVWHCAHGRDRTGLVTALVGMRLLGWSKDEAWQDMLAHGFRWELPDLDAFWLTEVP